MVREMTERKRVCTNLDLEILELCVVQSVPRRRRRAFVRVLDEGNVLATWNRTDFGEVWVSAHGGD